MPAVPTINSAERRRRVGARHFLATNGRADDPVAVSDALVGIHATDPASVYLGLRARTKQLTRERLGELLYEDRRLLKVLGMRRTMFVVPPPLASVIQAAVTTELGAGQRKRLLGMLERAGIAADPASWMAQVEDETVATLEELGEATAADLTQRVAGLREQIPFGAGKTWQGTVGVSTRLLFLLATEGRIIRGRPKGTWLSSLYRWVPMERWVEGGLEPWPPERARAELVRRWLAAFGPGTQRDIQWWTGWTVAKTRAALRDAGAIEVSIADGGERSTDGFALPGDVEETAEPGSWVALLPALDTTTMAWAERAFYLGDHAKLLFDTNGNAGPTVWVDGRVVGLWAQRESCEVVIRLLEDVGREQHRAIEAEASVLTEWLGKDRVFPRFPNPTFRELAAT
jgi:winged helix DNA-binding protein